ncbi:MAG: hypothetical protein Q8L66_02910 [Caulobacter sp.]|nr:hypothetical protein [Caulobacter sp.]
MKQYLEYIPAVTLAYIVGASVYVTGYFHYIGIQWIPILSVQDILALSWMVMPMVGIGATIGILAQVVDPKALPPRDPFASSEKTPSPFSVVVRIFYIFIVFLFACPAPILIFGLKNLVPVEFGTVFLFAGGAVYFAILRAVGLFAPEENMSRSIVIAHAIALTFLLYCFGLAAGSINFLGETRDVLTLTNGKRVCTHILAMPTKGLLVADSYQGSRVLFRADYVSVIQSQKTCKAVQPAPPPEKKK